MASTRLAPVGEPVPVSADAAPNLIDFGIHRMKSDVVGHTMAPLLPVTMWLEAHTRSSRRNGRGLLVPCEFGRHDPHRTV